MHISSSVLPCLAYLLFTVSAEDFNLTILHTNDVHARFQETNAFGGSCSSSYCFGGVARRHTIIQEIRRSHENVLLLDGGDQFQGTLWFNYYQGNATKYFMEQLGYDIMSLGNHEFDNGIKGLTQFLQGFSVPVVSANLNTDQVPALKGLYTSSYVLNVNGRDVGVIGYVSQLTPFLVLPKGIEGLVFEDVIQTVRREAQSLKSRGVNIVIALGHAGFAIDNKLAEEVNELDLVVGGHTNTFLYTGDPPSNETPRGPYPHIVTREDGSKVPVVQAYTAGKYLGYLNLVFNENGELQRWNGNPLLLNASVAEDPDILRKVKEWQKPLGNLSAEIVGRTLTFMDGQRDTCRRRECNMGNMATDALVRYVLARLPATKGWARAAICLWNSGGIRTSYPKGNISMGLVMETFPFRNTLEVVELRGKTILAMLENSVEKYSATGSSPGRFLQVSGIKVVYNLNKMPGSRVVSVDVLCTSCDIPQYSPLDPETDYMVVVNNYLVQGGDGYGMIQNEMLQYYPLGNQLTDCVIEFINSSSPLTYGLEGRIQFLEETPTTKTPEPNTQQVCENSGTTVQFHLLFSLLTFILYLISN